MASAPHKARSSAGLLERWARFSYRHRWPVIGTWVLALVGLLAANFMFSGEYSSAFRVPGSESQKAFDLLEERFPARGGDSADLVFEAPGGVASTDVRRRIEAVVEETRQIDGVVGVESPFGDPQLVSTDGTVARTDVDWSTRSGDVSSTSFEQFIAIVDGANGDGLRVETGGEVVWQNEEVAFGSEAYGLLAAVLILLIAFGSVIAMGLPLGAAVFALGAGFSVIGLGANFVDFPEFSPQFAAMIGIGVGIDYSLLIVTRFREGLHSGKSVEESVVLSVTTSGRAVIFAGMVVAVAFLGLFLMGLPFVAALGTAGAIVVICAVLVGLTLTPALLSLTGRRIDSLRVPFLHATEGVDPKSVWYRLSGAIQRHPLPYFLGTTAVLLVLAAPALTMDLGFTDAGNTPESQHTRRAYDLLTKGFGPGFNGKLIVVADISQGGSDRIAALRDAMARDENVEEIEPTRTNGAGDTALIAVIPKTKPQDNTTNQLVHRLRADVIPPVMAGSTGEVYITGGVASFLDGRDRITSRMPLLFAGVIGLSFLLLTLVFRSVVVAAKAAIMNLLSIGASYGVLVAIFQWGWFANVIGIEKGPIETFLPMMMFAILFGLSMDYEVFLISRVREEYLKTHDNASAVSHGLAATARVITAAAAIMVAVFLTFVLGDDRVIKEFGIGLATAIFVDATIVRLVLVPSTMELLGDRNWWLPGWLDRILPHVSFETTEEEPVAVSTAAGGG